MQKPNFQKLHVYALAETLVDPVWEVVSRWQSFPRDTVGKQLVRAADSIGANIAEGRARGSYQDNRRFVRIARGSLTEVQHWLRRAYTRGLLSDEDIDRLRGTLDELSPGLNAYLKSIGKSSGHAPRA